MVCFDDLDLVVAVVDYVSHEHRVATPVRAAQSEVAPTVAANDASGLGDHRSPPARRPNVSQAGGRRPSSYAAGP